jgi:hypothetical protein
MGVYTNSGNLPQFSSNSRDYPSFFWFWESIYYLILVIVYLHLQENDTLFLLSLRLMAWVNLINLIKRIPSQAKLALARIISWSRSILIFSNSLLHYNLQMIQHEVLGTLHVNIKLQINKI